MKILSNPEVIKQLVSIGIKKAHADLLVGQECKPTGRAGDNYIQVEFDGKILNKDEPFVYCVPLSAIA